MEHPDRVPNTLLLQTGLQMMAEAGMPLEKAPTKGRAMIYKMENGETVRIRTSNDHLLVVVADRDEENAKLNIEGTDHLLIVMPESERTFGSVIAYFLPSETAVKAARKTHKDWQATNPNTKGNNTTWNLWFSGDGPDKASGFDTKWKKHLLPVQGHVRNEQSKGAEGKPSHKEPKSLKEPAENAAPAPGGKKLIDVINDAKQMIADAAGISTENVKITLDIL